MAQERVKTRAETAKAESLKVIHPPWSDYRAKSFHNFIGMELAASSGARTTSHAALWQTLSAVCRRHVCDSEERNTTAILDSKEPDNYKVCIVPRLERPYVTGRQRYTSWSQNCAAMFCDLQSEVHAPEIPRRRGHRKKVWKDRLLAIFTCNPSGKRFKRIVFPKRCS